MTNRSSIASIILAVGAIAFFALVLPKYDSISNTRAALEARQLLLDERKAGLEKIGELDKQYKARQADIDKVIVFIPAQKRIDQIVSSLQQISSQAGLSLTGMTTAGSAETGEGVGYKEIFINFDIMGQYPSFVNFLKLLEQSLRLYDVFEIVASMNTASSTGAQNLVNFTIKLNAYSLK